MPTFSALGPGLGLRSPHASAILETQPREVTWFEAITENYLGTAGGDGGQPIRVLETLRRDYAIVLHGVSLSLGSTDPLSQPYLKAWKHLIRRIDPAWVSDHLCWTGVDGQNLHDLLPLPYTCEALDHVAARIERVQEYLARPILIENVSSYLRFRHSEMPEQEFLATLARRTGCGILLDVNNVYVSAVNLGFDPAAYLDALPAEHVGQIHLAGHSERGGLLIDTHDHPVAEPVWDLYRLALRRFGRVSTMVEWDAKLPELPRLLQEVGRAGRILAEREETHVARDAALAL